MTRMVSPWRVMTADQCLSAIRVCQRSGPPRAIVAHQRFGRGLQSACHRATAAGQTQNRCHAFGHWQRSCWGRRQTPHDTLPRLNSIENIPFWHSKRQLAACHSGDCLSRLLGMAACPRTFRPQPPLDQGPQWLPQFRRSFLCSNKERVRKINRRPRAGKPIPVFAEGRREAAGVAGASVSCTRSSLWSKDPGMAGTCHVVDFCILCCPSWNSGPTMEE